MWHLDRTLRLGCPYRKLDVKSFCDMYIKKNEINTYQGYNTTKQLSNAFRKHSKQIMSSGENEVNATAMALMADGTHISRKELIHCGIYGMYSSTTNKIHFMGGEYSASGFGVAHVKVLERSQRKSCNGWTECYYKVDGEWKPLDNLREQLRRQRTTTPVVVEEDENTSEMVIFATPTPLCYSSISSPFEIILHIIADRNHVHPRTHLHRLGHVHHLHL